MSSESQDLSSSVTEQTFIGLSDRELQDILDLRMGSLYSGTEKPVLPALLTAFQQRMIEANRGQELFVGSYLLESQIGSGGMGVVYRAIHLSMGRTVALKVLSPELLKSQLAVSRFLREVRAVSKLQHPNIVTAFDAKMTEEEHYLAMELVEGSDLDRIVRAQGPFSIPEATEIIRQVAEALDSVHKQGMIHRDIKPSNLMLDPEGQVKVTDFGLTKLGFTEIDSGGEGLTHPGTIIGSIDYLAPEQARDFRIATPTADIYSLGCTLNYLLTGSVPFKRTGIIETLTAHQFDQVESLTEIRPDVPHSLNQLYQEMLAKKPENRPASMGEIAERLREFHTRPMPDWFLKRKLPTEQVPAQVEATLQTALPGTGNTKNTGKSSPTIRLENSPTEPGTTPAPLWLRLPSIQECLLYASILAACFALLSS